MNILIADCGSTKAHWALCHTGGTLQVRTTGFNPAVTSAEDIDRVLREELLPTLPYGVTVDEVWFYGAGCIGGAVDQALAALLARLFPDAEITVASDLLGAARAVLGTSAGIVGILGTGSNTGLYDGFEFPLHNPPLGYILGDEGSGASLGKRLVNRMYRLPDGIPADIVETFFKEYGLSQAQLIERVYRRPGANRFLASFAPFLSRNIHRGEIAALVEDEMRQFVRRNLLPYRAKLLQTDGGKAYEADLAEGIKCGFVGSIAWHFAPQLINALKAGGIPEPSAILLSPIDSLVKFHTENPGLNSM